jgi:tRNA-splicing ligase RtcB/Archease protein family (MTH1598/TM1083)
MSQSAASSLGQPRWEHFPHDADVGVRGFGATAAEAFEQAALALTAVVTHAGVASRIPVAVTCEESDIELLFVDDLAAQGILIRSPSTRGGEAPGAYKDVNAVVAAAEHAGLARRVARLRPLICVKG